jgi:hypothetical protein
MIAFISSSEMWETSARPLQDGQGVPACKVFDRAIAKCQGHQRFRFHREIGIESHLHRQSPIPFSP